MTLDLNKPLQTKNKQPVTIVSVEGRGDFPLIGYIGDSFVVESWTKDGKYGCVNLGDAYDLENTQEVVERYLTIFKDDTTGQYYAAPFLHAERHKSDKYARDMSEYQINKTCVARLKLAFVEGQFDDF